MLLLPILSVLYLSAAAPNPAVGLLDADDDSLLRAMGDEPARVVWHIRAQQRRIEWLEHQLQQGAPGVHIQPTSQGWRLSGTEEELRPESSSNQRATASLAEPHAPTDANAAAGLREEAKNDGFNVAQHDQAVRCLLELRLAGSEPEPWRACRTTALEALGVPLASNTEGRRLSTSARDLSAPQDTTQHGSMYPHHTYTHCA